MPAEPEQRDKLREQIGDDEIPALVLDDGTAIHDGADAIIAWLDERFDERPDAAQHRKAAEKG